MEEEAIGQHCFEIPINSGALQWCIVELQQIVWDCGYMEPFREDGGRVVAADA